VEGDIAGAQPGAMISIGCAGEKIQDGKGNALSIRRVHHGAPCLS
jgi:hypothetical protein